MINYCYCCYSEICLKIIQSIYTAWRQGIRRIWHLPNTTHSALIPDLNYTLPLLDMFNMHIVNFVYKCLQSESSLVYGITRRGIICGQMDSIIGRNVINCSLCYKISLDNIINLHFQPRDIYCYYRTNEGSSALISSLFELLQCRDVSLSLSSREFSTADISSMIDYICTS